MAKVFDKHIRISNKRYRLHTHLSQLPPEAVRDEMLTLMEIGLAMLNSTIKHNITVNDIQAHPGNAQAVHSTKNDVTSDVNKNDEFDISDAMFSVYE